MNCDLDRIEALRNGTLSAEECEAVRTHIKECPTCRVWYAALEELDREVAAPVDFADRVMAQVRTTPQTKKKTNRRWQRSVAAVAACLVLVTVLGFGPLRGMLVPDGQTDVPMTRKSEGEVLPAPYSNESAQTLQQWMEELEGQQAVVGIDQTDVVLTQEQCAAARTWLQQHQYTAEVHRGGGSGYCLHGKEAAAFGEAVLGKALPETGTLYVFLPEQL